MIVHVYNPERILNSATAGKTPTKKSAPKISTGANQQAQPTSQQQRPNVVKQQAQQPLQHQQPSSEILKPPPSPRLLRNSLFKGFNNKTATDTANKAASSCIKTLKSRDKEAMDCGGAAAAAADGTQPSWAQQQGRPSAASSSPSAAPPPSQVSASCTCHSSTGPSSHHNESSRPESQAYEMRNPSVTSSPATSHYFTPSSSFHHDDSGRDVALDSLEYRRDVPVVDVKTTPVRKASLDRILSPKSSSSSERSRVYTSSPSSTSSANRLSPDKSLSPVVSNGAVHHQLNTSMSNASIHSNYSEDSLVAATATRSAVSDKFGHQMQQQQQPCCHCSHYNGRHGSVAGSLSLGHHSNPRWSNPQYDSPCGSHAPLGQSTWIADAGSCMAVEARPLGLNSATPISSSSGAATAAPRFHVGEQDFSKDSLNSTSNLDSPPAANKSSSADQTAAAGAAAGAATDATDGRLVSGGQPSVGSAFASRQVDAAADGAECESAASKKPEPLAFTIDFGDLSGVKGKKKETPKRFTERLAASGHKRSLSQSKAFEDKKGESSDPSPSSFAGERMLKSLSRVSDNPLTKFNNGSDDAEVTRLAAPLAANKNGRTATASSRHSSASREFSHSKSASANRRKRSPSPPPSPLKSSFNSSGGGGATSNQREPAVYNNGSTAKGQRTVDVQQARSSLLESTSKLSKLGHEIQMSASFSEVSSHAMARKETVNRRSSLSSELRMEEPDESRWLLDHQSLESSILKEALQRKQVVAGLVDRHLADAEQSSSDALVSGEITSAEERDDASETGTYTIGKDSPSPDEEQSRRDIDRVFGLIPEADVSKMRSLSGLELDNRSTPNWIREWAAQVAQQQEAPPAVPATNKPPSAPRQSPAAPVEAQHSSQRPRRRLPSVPPTAGSSRSRSSPRPSDMSDPSDSSLETESFLRDTESVVSAMQARVDGRSSTESDAELRHSGNFQAVQQQQQADLEHNLGRKLSAQLRAKIRSLDESYTTTSSARGVIRETSYVVSSTPTVIHNELHGCEDAKSVHSDSSSDVTSGEATSRSRHTHHEDAKAIQNSAPVVRYNRALSLRRGRLGLDTDQSASTASGSSSAGPKDRRHGNVSPTRGASPQVANRKLSTPATAAPTPAAVKSAATPPVPPAASGSSFSRNDGGRYSLRSMSASKVVTSSSSASVSSPTPANGRSKASKNLTNLHGQSASMGAGVASSGRKSRSNSTLSSKEAEFQNWKRRKNYDPMKAAAEGKKKEAARKAATITMSQSMIGTVSSRVADSSSSQSPSPPPRSMIRSASFTCVNNVDGLPTCEILEPQYNNSRRTSQHKPVTLQHSNAVFSSEDESDIVFSPKQKPSPKPSPMAPRKYLGLSLNATSLNSPPSLTADLSDLASIASNDLDLTSSPGSPRRKLYMEDGLLMRTSASNSSLRARTKLEALDNLVISTIYGMSSKIRTNAESLMRKLRPQYVGDLERLGLIDDTLNRLSECATESPINSVTAARSSSRELSGTLKIMKRVEQVFQALDQVLFEEVLEGGGEEGAILHDGTATEGEDWNGYTSGEFY